MNRRLHDEAVEGRIGDINAHLPQLFEAMTAALAGLRRDRAALTADTILFLTLTDSDEAEAVEDHSAQHMNPPVLLTLFSERYG